jgi:hypothetical protein
VEAHGSLARALCTNPACEEPVIDMEHHVWEVVARGAVPYCPACGDGGRNETPPLPSLFCPLLTTISLRAAVRPDVVFFGEPLPRKFFELNLQDFKTCDLLIVMGWRPPPPAQPTNFPHPDNFFPDRHIADCLSLRWPGERGATHHSSPAHQQDLRRCLDYAPRQ